MNQNKIRTAHQNCHGILACLAFLSGTGVLLCLTDFVLGDHCSALAAALFSGISLLDAVLFHRMSSLRPMHDVLYVIAVLTALCMIALRGAGGIINLLWLLLLPVFNPLLLGVKRGAFLDIAILSGLFLLPCAIQETASFYIAEFSAFRLQFSLVYILFCLAGILLEKLRVHAARQYIQQTQALKTLSCTDDLTGLYNRRWYSELLKSRSGRPEYRRRYAVFLIDIDNFKSVNDIYGHLCGDQVLVSVAKTIGSVLCPDDLVCRWGGDEFLCQVRVPSPEGALAMAEELREKIVGMRFSCVDGQALTITVSIGAVFVPNPSEVYSDALFDIADRALYEAKRNGRNCVSLHVSQGVEPKSTYC